MQMYYVLCFIVLISWYLCPKLSNITSCCKTHVILEDLYEDIFALKKEVITCIQMDSLNGNWFCLCEKWLYDSHCGLIEQLIV